MTRKMAVVWVGAVLLGGCHSSVKVVRNPGPGDSGIRYYRPKPYLMVTPADPTGGMVKLEILQLPDYCEEYSILPKGKKPPAVQLKDGWNLVGVGGPPAPPEAPAPAPAPPPADSLKLPEAVLVAGNVPIGLYESVFDVAGPVKYLKGWRYVGFGPFGSSGPANGTDAEGVKNLQNGCPPCVRPGSSMQGPVYGLVFFNGAMTFRQLDEIGNNMTCPEYIKPPIRGAGPQYITPTPAEGTGPAIQATPATEEEGRRRQPVAPGSPTPPAPNPGSASWTAPRPDTTLPDAGVRQASGSDRPTTPAARSSTATIAIPPPKPVDPKKLRALENEAFKSLSDSQPPSVSGPAVAGSVGAAGDSPLPSLIPAIPGR